MKYVIKVDDDNFVRLDRLAVAVQQWEYFGAGMAPWSLSILVILPSSR